MKEKSVLFEKRGFIGMITLNRPEQKNAITVEMASELRDIRAGIGWDSGITVFLITGRGPDFSIGTDPEVYQLFDQREDLIANLSLASQISSLTQPTIAVIQGDALGQGLELALACDIRMASDQSHFSMSQIIRNEIPFDGGTQRLPRLVGRTKALELILTGQQVDYREANRIGLVNRVLPTDELMPSALMLAEELSAKGPIALRYAKEAVLKGLDMTLEQGLRLEADLYFLIHTTQDRREGITAFREKRRPEFEGK
ncbi:MAG: enoyl-CoA hydratase/isomerase family protein [Deltaproteobacteria bacterium]|nr:enoyl-CoA hydratase/isomerase family protein [Deltaproteobacteria bacterium]